MRAVLARVAWVVVFAAAVRPAAAMESSYDPVVDGAATLAAGGLLLGSALAKQSLGGMECRWCDHRPDGSDSLNGLDRATRASLKWGDTALASTASDLVASGALPAAAVALLWLGRPEQGLHPALIDTLILAQDVIASALLTQALKLSLRRERPFFHALGGPPGGTVDSHLSFPSGHSDAAFSLAVGLALLSERREYRFSAAVWGSALAGAAMVGYLRIAADAHYLTDVLAGAALGSATAWVIVALHPLREEAPVSVSLLPLRDGAGIALWGAF